MFSGKEVQVKYRRTPVLLRTRETPLSHRTCLLYRWHPDLIVFIIHYVFYYLIFLNPCPHCTFITYCYSLSLHCFVLCCLALYCVAVVLLIQLWPPIHLGPTSCTCDFVFWLMKPFLRLIGNAGGSLWQGWWGPVFSKSNTVFTSSQVPISKFQDLRYNVALILKEMNDLEKRSILKIQD